MRSADMFYQDGRSLYALPGGPYGVQLTDAVYKAIKAQPGTPVDALDWVHYDQFRFKPATAVGTTPQRLFQIPVGAQAQVFNAAGETYTKDDIDTNQELNSQLPSGEAIIVDSIQVRLVIPGQTDTTYPTSGVGTEQPTNTAAAAKSDSVNQLQAMLEQATLKFHVGTKDYEQGPLCLFPTEFGISGFAGAATSNGNESVANNGFGRPRLLMIQRLIPPQVNFWVEIRFIQALTIVRQCNLKVLLKGYKLRPVQ